MELLPSIWNWLPAFRAVAETEHLPTAARRVHVTPSALSRSIRQLEDTLGHALFVRAGGRFVLNTQGHRLLAAVRDAQQALDAGVNSITCTSMHGPVRISSLGVLTHDYVLPAVLALRREHPTLLPVLVNERPRTANDLLSRGQLDVAFYYDALAPEDLVVARLGESTSSIYCGRDHPLFEAEEPTIDEVLEHPFSVASIGDRGVPMDGWPVEIPRKVGMQIYLLATNLEVCLSGQLLTVLPDVVAYPHLGHGLRRLPLDLIPPVALYACRRREDQDNSTLRVIIERVQRQIADVERRLSVLRGGPAGTVPKTAWSVENISARLEHLSL